MPPTLNFFAPSLHPNTLLDISYPEPGPSTREPIVRHLAIKHGGNSPIGTIKRILSAEDDRVVVADDAFRISTLSLGSTHEPSPPPEVITQHVSTSRKGDVWAGLIPVRTGVISALTSGLLTLHPSTSPDPGRESNTSSPLIAVSSSGSSATTLALAGKELDVSIRDVERTFSSPTGPTTAAAGKRKKDTLEPGETWRARNLPNNSLSLRSPIHHLSLAHLPDSETSLISGTKAGTVRRYDTRQRKPVSDWKVAKEGGIGCVVPGAEHELFFADRSSLVGVLDLRTGRLLYSYSGMTCTAHHLLPIPSPNAGGTGIGLASIASDATLRLHTTVSPPNEGAKGNPVGEGRKPKIVGMVGGVGIGNAVWRGWGTLEDEEVRADANGDQGESGDDEDGDGGVWEGMSEVEDESDLDDEEETPKRPKT